MFALLAAIVFAPMTAYLYALDQQDLARAKLPVTAIASLVPGSSTKINGTIEANMQIVIKLVGSGNNAYWLPSPFNVSDRTGRVSIDPSAIRGVSSYRVVQRGLHGDDWWNGDSVSIIGEVRTNESGSIYVAALYVATAPERFSSGSFDTPVLATLSLTAIVATVILIYINVHQRILHRENAPRFQFKVRSAGICRNCGAGFPAGSDRCPSCGRPTGMTSHLPTGGGTRFANLPRLQLERRFSQRSVRERAAVVIFGLAVPALLISIGVWLFVTSPFGIGTISYYLLIFGVVLVVVIGKDYLGAETVVLSSSRIEVRRPWKTQVADPSEVDLVLTMHKKNRAVHCLLTRGDDFVGFGPGISSKDFESAREWLKAFALQRGLEYKEVEAREALELLANRGPRRRRS